MYRPKNETQDDIAAELEAQAMIESAWRVKVIKLQPMVYSADWVLVRADTKQMHSWVEFKRRRVKKLQHETLLLSLGKWAKLNALALQTGLPFAVYVQWDDTKVEYVSIAAGVLPNFRYALMHRNDRNQPGDEEPCVEIPINRFRPVKVLKCPGKQTNEEWLEEYGDD